MGMHASLCDFLTDIAQNSFEADATNVGIVIEQNENWIIFSVTDDGKGMSPDQQKRALDPFYSDGIKHKKRKVGLGLPFLYQMVESVGGEFSLSSEVGKGTVVYYTVPLSHIDTPPLGDIPSTLSSLFSYPSSADLIVKRAANRNEIREEYEVSKSELLEVLQEVNTVSNIILMKTFLQSQEAAIEEFLQRV